MSVAKYEYSISGDFPAGFDSDRMMVDVQGSAIVTALYRIATAGDLVEIWFKAPLSAGDEVVLDAVVAAHSGLPLPPDPTVITTEDLSPRGSPMVALNAPIEADGKPNFVPVPFTQGLYMFVTSRGDDLTGGVLTRGGGAQMKLTYGPAESGPKEAVATFHETVELHDGHVDFDPADWGFDDEWSILLRIPATTVEPSVGGTGNCNLAAAMALAPWDSGTVYSPGGMVTHGGVNYLCHTGHSNQEPPNAAYWVNAANVVVPAAGDGAYDVDLDEAVAVPYEGAGYWDYDPWDDAFAPSATPGSADWMVFDFPMYDVYMVKGLMCSSRLGYWELDAYKVEPIYPRWQLVFAVDRDQAGPAIIGGHFTCFREETT